MRHRLSEFTPADSNHQKTALLAPTPVYYSPKPCMQSKRDVCYKRHEMNFLWCRYPLRNQEACVSSWTNGKRFVSCYEDKYHRPASYRVDLMMEICVCFPIFCSASMDRPCYSRSVVSLTSAVVDMNWLLVLLFSNICFMAFMNHLDGADSKIQQISINMHLLWLMDLLDYRLSCCQTSSDICTGISRFLSLPL